MGSRGRQILPVVVVFLALCGYGRAIPVTRVQDILFNADGTKVDGSATIEWKGFIASDGSTLATNAITVRIVQGVLKVDLVPNEGATPEGTSYKVTYLLDNGIRFVETWVVPESSSVVTMNQVRVSQPPPVNLVIAQSQVSGLVADLDKKAGLDEENVFTEAQTIEEAAPGAPDPLLSFRQSGGPNSVGFRIPSLTVSSIYTLPVADGLPGQQLTTDGGGSLFWADGGSGAGSGTAYEIFQDSGTSVTQRNVANFSNGLTVADNSDQMRTEVQPVYGSTAGTITEGDDPRLSDARTPLAHASTHAAAGSDPVTPASIGALKNANDTITTTSPSLTPLNVAGAVGQTAPLQTWRDGEGELMALIAPEGSTFVREMGINSELGGTVSNLIMQVDGLNKFAFSAFDTTLNVGRYDDVGAFKDVPLQILREGDILMNTSVKIKDPTASTGATNVSIQAGAGQGSTPLQEWKDSSGTVLASIGSNGNLRLDDHFLELTEQIAPPPPGPSQVRLFVDSSNGELSVKKDSGAVVSLEQGGGSGGSFGVFEDAETPAGAIDGVNAVFTLQAAPNPPESLELTRNGLVQNPGTDFTLSSDTITFLAGAIPQPGDSLLAWYRTDGSNAGGDLTGTYPNPVVSGIRSRVVSASAPADGECLVWSASNTQWEPKACGKVTNSLQWHFPGTPSTGLQPMTLTIPEGVSGGLLVDSRIVANTPGDASSYNIARCTSGCSGTSPVFSAIYSGDLTLPLDTRTATGGTPDATNVNAGDQFRVNLVSIGSGAADVTVSLTYRYLAAN